jgi:PA14 domain-containing protein
MKRRASGGVVALIALVAACAALAGARAALNVRHGLRAEYFENITETGRPTFTTIDAEISTSNTTADWVGDPPPAFSARWFGYVMIDRPGSYTFGTRSDDGSWLRIDGRLVVDNGGNHGPLTGAGTIDLGAGPHALLIDYLQTAGEYEIGLLWGNDLSPIPAWRLSPSRVAPWKMPLARAVDWLWDATLALVASVASWILLTSGRRGAADAVRRRPRAAAFLFFVVLTVIETWPLAAHPARLSRNDNGDTILNEWTLAWVAHEAPHAPLHLYDANIFYPEARTIAYSESMIAQSAMAAPLLWSGASPVLAYNLVLLAGFALSGWAMSLVIAQWTGSWTAAIVSGLLFAFNAHTFTRLPHLQALHVEFFPLTIYALDALLSKPGARRALWLAAWFTLEALTSVYLLLFTALAVVAATLVRPEAWTGRRFKTAAPLMALAALAAGAALFPFLLPYWRVHHDQGLSRSLVDAAHFAASWQDYLSTPGRLHYALWSHVWFSTSALFPGVLGVGLSIVAIARGVAFRDARARMCVAFGVAGVVLSFGPSVPGYSVLYALVPLMQSVRAVSRFGYLGIVAVAMLAGFGVVEVRRWIAPSLWAPAAVALIAVATLEPFCAPIWFARFDGISPIYEGLRHDPHAIVVEFPFYSTAASFHHAPYMLNSTAHWKPMLNGYSGFQPPSFEENVAAFANFPDSRSIAALKSKGVTDVFVHVNETGSAVPAALDVTAGVHRVAADGAIVRYKIE